MDYFMKLAAVPFNQIKEGIKTIEVRLNDEKRKKLKVGDEVTFTNIETGDILKKAIVKLEKYNSFSDLFKKYDAMLFGGSCYTLDQMVNNMYQYYTKEDEKKYGVLAIFLNEEDLDLREHFVSRKYPFDGKLLHVREDVVKLPNEELAKREWIEHCGASAIVVVDEEDNIYLERQFRYPIGKVVVEIPAGKLNSILEDPKEAAKRELQEETGFISKELVFLGKMHVSVAYSTEAIYIYYVNEFDKGKQNLDEDENLNLFKIPFKDALDMVLNNEITDSKTVAGILLYEKLKNKKDN